MFTGIVMAAAEVVALDDRPGLRTLTLRGPRGFTAGLEIGASVAVAGCCLTATEVLADSECARFDVMRQTLAQTMLGALREGSRVNVERSARGDSEVGGHIVSGHVDSRAAVAEVRRPENNHVIRIDVPMPWMRYLFVRGFVAVDGASLTIADAGRNADGSGWFEVWLIPETLRLTTFGELQVGHAVNLEIDRRTQVIVDTVRAAVDERLAPLLPALREFAAERGIPLPNVGD